MKSRGNPRIAIDVGGTKIAAAIVADHRIVERRQIATPRRDVATLLTPAIVSLIAPLTANVPGAIGVATTGFASAGRVSAVNPLTLPFPDRFDFGGQLAASTGREVMVMNDALAATWGEYLAGAGQGMASFAFLTVSTGVGGGMVHGGNLLTAPSGLAGHLGHVSVDLDGPACGCGRQGCVEAIASGAAIARRARELTGGPWENAEAVIAAAEAGNAACISVLDSAAAALASLCCSVKAVIDPECIAIGGGVGLNAAFQSRLRRAMALAPPLFRANIVPARLGADAGLIGIAALISRNDPVRAIELGAHHNRP